MRRSFAVINQCAAMVAVGLAGCTQVPTVPLASGAPASLLILSAREITDTIDAPLAEPLTVKLVDSAGNFVPGKIVKFLAPPPLEGVSYRGPVLVGATLAGAGQTAYSVATDSLGVARAYMKTTPAVGRFFVRAQTAEPGLSDSVLIAVRPGAPVRITLAPKDTAVYGGATYPLVVRAFDHGGNPPLEPIALTVRRPGVASLDGDGVVQANATGRTYAVASVGSVRDSAGVSVVPHGTILAVNRRYSSGETMAFFLLELDGSTYRVVSPVQYGFNQLGQYFLPGGDLVVYHGRYNDGSAPLRLFRMDLDGHVAGLLEPGGQIVEAVTPQPSRDGAWVYFTAITGYETAEIWRVRPDGTGPARVGPVSTQGDQYFAPSPSPDGSQLAVTVDRTPLIQGVHLGIMNVATGGTQLVRQAAGRARWSPVASEIAQFGGGGIWIVRPDGQPLLGPIAPGPNPSIGWDTGDGQIDWSPDGRWLIACQTGGSAGARSLALVDRLSGEVLPLAYTARDQLCGATWRPR